MFFAGIKSWTVYFYLFILILCFLLFQQGDLAHTTTSSYAYLNGHFADFYDYNQKPMGRNDYLPLLYVIFALWNVPLYLFGLLSSPEFWRQLSAIEIAWAKLLLVFFFFAATKVLAKISEIIADDNGEVKASAASIFATAPIAIFVVFIFSQYDIIAIFFTLIGFYFYLKKQWSGFAWFFSIAISFKYFALIIYFPLLLMVEKKLLTIAKFMAIGFFITIIQYGVYSGSEIFRDNIFFLAKSKLAGDEGTKLSFLNPKIGIAALYLWGCFWLYLKKFDNESEWKKIAVLVPIMAYGLMFSAIRWFPHWIIIVTPFFSLAYIYVRNKKLFAYIDMLGMLSFVWVIVNFWPDNVDVTMINHGVLNSFIPQPALIISDLMSLTAVPDFLLIFHIYLFSPILIILIESCLMKYCPIKEIGNYLVLGRFFVGVSCFLIPALVCTFVPLPMLLKINKNILTNNYHQAAVVNPHNNRDKI